MNDAAVNRAVFSADGKWLAANPSERFPGKAVKVWNTETWKEAASLSQENGFPAFWFDFSEAESGRWLVRVGQESNPIMVQGLVGVMISPFTVAVWDAATLKREFGITLISTGIPGADISADGRLLAMAKGGGATQLFDLEQKKPFAVLASPDAWPGNLTISPDGQVVVQGAREGVRLWRLPAITAGSN